MDEGTAALITAAVGLIGAIAGAAIGGIAATRGARIGAETTARATARQVQDQAVVDHEHWLRDQRLEAYRAMLIAYDAYVDAAGAMERALTRAALPTVTEPLEYPALGPAGDAVVRAYVVIRLVGPDNARDAADELQERVRSLNEGLSALRVAVLQMQANARALRERAEQAKALEEIEEVEETFEASAREAQALAHRVEALKSPAGSAHGTFVSVVNTVVAGATVR